MPDPAGPPGTDPGQGGDGPKYVTEEQLNKAITARFTDFSKKTEKTWEGFATTLTSKLEEMFKPAQPPAAAEPKTDDPVLKGMQKKIAEQDAAIEQWKQNAAAEREKSRQATLRTTLTDLLVKSGVDGSKVKHAVGFLVDAEKRVRYQEGGDDLVFVDPDGEVDLATGIKSWVGSDDGKLYLPPRGVTGSGDRGTGKAPKSGTPQNSVENIGRLILEQFG